MKSLANMAALLAALFYSFSISADELSDIAIYREYSAT